MTTDSLEDRVLVATLPKLIIAVVGILAAFGGWGVSYCSRVVRSGVTEAENLVDSQYHALNVMSEISGRVRVIRDSSSLLWRWQNARNLTDPAWLRHGIAFDSEFEGRSLSSLAYEAFSNKPSTASIELWLATRSLHEDLVGWRWVLGERGKLQQEMGLTEPPEQHPGLTKEIERFQEELSMKCDTVLLKVDAAWAELGEPPSLLGVAAKVFFSASE